MAPYDLSIIIPAHNEEHHIGACLESITAALNEAVCTAEIIVVNNASTDRTKEIAESHECVRVVDEPRKGTNRARQTGFEHSRGALIANLDADVLVSREWFETALREFNRNTKLVALSGPYIYYDLAFWQHLFVIAYYALSYPIYLVSRLFGRVAFLTGGNVVIRRTALEAAGGYNTSLVFYGDDTDTAIRLRKIGRVKFKYLFTVYTSGRRILQEGLFQTGARYVFNQFSIALTGRPYSRTVNHIRRNETQSPR